MAKRVRIFTEVAGAEPCVRQLICDRARLRPEPCLGTRRSVYHGDGHVKGAADLMAEVRLLSKDLCDYVEYTRVDFSSSVELVSEVSLPATGEKRIDCAGPALRVRGHRGFIHGSIVTNYGM